MASSFDTIRTLVDRRGAVANRDVVRALHVSAATAHRLLRSMVSGGALAPTGSGRAARYRFPSVRRRFRRRGLEEHRVWSSIAESMTRVRPLLPDESRSLQYAATEVINNAIEHSRGGHVTIGVEYVGAGSTLVTVRDDGVGVFRRVCEDFGIASPQEAIVQLEKGKLTSDPTRHSGEGLFFSSKAVSRFRLESQTVAWIVDNLLCDSAVGTSRVSSGTLVTLEVVRGRTPQLDDVFRAYTEPQTLRFMKTRATVKLGAIGDSLLSRSEAKRIVAGLSKFRHVTLDFSGVDVVGQGFCDEIFRVFARAHPEVEIAPVGMNDPVAFMVNRARAASTPRPS